MSAQTCPVPVEAATVHPVWCRGCWHGRRFVVHRGEPELMDGPEFAIHSELSRVDVAEPDGVQPTYLQLCIVDQGWRVPAELDVFLTVDEARELRDQLDRHLNRAAGGGR